MLVGTVRDITQQKTYEIELERLSLTDELTGAYNRRYCHNRLEQLFSSAIKRGASVALAVLDIDLFKDVNDTYGHDIGDEVLKKFANKIKELSRSTDIFARYGGEEFVLIMENCDLDRAYRRIERIRQAIEKFKIKTSAGELSVTLTAGVSIINKQDKNTDDVFRRADQALYTGKQKGRNQVVLAEENT